MMFRIEIESYITFKVIAQNSVSMTMKSKLTGFVIILQIINNKKKRFIHVQLFLTIHSCLSLGICIIFKTEKSNKTFHCFIFIFETMVTVNMVCKLI